MNAEFVTLKNVCLDFSQWVTPSEPFGQQILTLHNSKIRFPLDGETMFKNVMNLNLEDSRIFKLDVRFPNLKSLTCLEANDGLSFPLSLSTLPSSIRSLFISKLATWTTFDTFEDRIQLAKKACSEGGPIHLAYKVMWVSSVKKLI